MILRPTMLQLECFASIMAVDEGAGNSSRTLQQSQRIKTLEICDTQCFRTSVQWTYDWAFICEKVGCALVWSVKK